MLLGAGVFDLFEARQQALRLLEKVLDRFGEKLRGIDRLTRTERIHAAHEVIRITAYFDAFGAALTEWKPQFSAAEQAWLTTGTDPDAAWRGFFQDLCRKEHYGSPLWDSTSLSIFTKISADMLKRLSGLALWDDLGATGQGRLSTVVQYQVPQDAADRYQENLRRLAADCPEFGVWLNLQAHAATREPVGSGLAGLETLLAPLTERIPRSTSRIGLTRAYRADLAKPIMVTSGP